MGEILIQINKRIAIVSLTKKQYDERSSGLIQYLSNFVDKITWNVKDSCAEKRGSEK